MVTMQGKPIFKGIGTGSALKTQSPVNFTASFTKIANLLPLWRSQFRDRHHDYFKNNAKGKVLVLPAVIGSTYTGMVLLELIANDCAPAAMIVQTADSLLVSGPVLGETWFQKSFPIVECPGNEIFEQISNNDRITVNGDTGEIQIHK